MQSEFKVPVRSGGKQGSDCPQWPLITGRWREKQWKEVLLMSEVETSGAP